MMVANLSHEICLSVGQLLSADIGIRLQATMVANLYHELCLSVSVNSAGNVHIQTTSEIRRRYFK
jgi:hypothetical protein